MKNYCVLVVAVMRVLSREIFLHLNVKAGNKTAIFLSNEALLRGAVQILSIKIRKMRKSHESKLS